MAKKIKSAGAFDIRNVIGILIGIYGVALVPGRYQSLQHAESTADSSAQAESSH